MIPNSTNRSQWYSCYGLNRKYSFQCYLWGTALEFHNGLLDGSHVLYLRPSPPANIKFKSYQYLDTGYYTVNVIKTGGIIPNFDPNAFAAIETLVVFDRNAKGNTSRLYDMQIYDDDGVLVRNFIPCLDPDGIPCLYCLVTQKAYYKSGDGELLYGEYELKYTGKHYLLNAHCDDSLPLGYTKVNYLQSTGTQWIDSGISGGSNASYEIKFNPITASPAYAQIFAGDRNSTIPKIYMGERSSIQYQAFGNTTTQSDITQTLALGQARTIVYNVNGQLYSDEASLGTISKAAGLGWGTLTWYLFNSNSEQNLASSVKIYYCKMYTDKVLVRNFIPCLDLSGRPCMYDAVTKQPFYNIGSGEFLYG